MSLSKYDWISWGVNYWIFVISFLFANFSSHVGIHVSMYVVEWRSLCGTINWCLITQVTDIGFIVEISPKCLSSAVCWSKMIKLLVFCYNLLSSWFLELWRIAHIKVHYYFLAKWDCYISFSCYRMFYIISLLT